MNTQSFAAVKVAEWDDAWDHGIGAFFFSGGMKSMLCMMPDKDGTPQLVSFNLDTSRKDCACWSWNGNKEKPTLSPSLHWVGHGHLKDGFFQSC